MAKRSEEYAKGVKMRLAARMRQEAEADELRRQVEELRQELDSVLSFLVDVLRRDLGMTEEAVENHAKVIMARAALARWGGAEVTE